MNVVVKRSFIVQNTLCARCSRLYPWLRHKLKKLAKKKNLNWKIDNQKKINEQNLKKKN